MPKSITTTKYECSFCHSIFLTEEEAAKCEAKHQELFENADKYCFQTEMAWRSLYANKFHKRLLYEDQKVTTYQFPELVTSCCRRGTYTAFYFKRPFKLPILENFDKYKFPKFCPFCGKQVKQCSDYEFREVCEILDKQNKEQH